jgi:hypothetical protein
MAGPSALSLSSQRDRDWADIGFADALDLVLSEAGSSLLHGALVDDLVRARLG